MTQFISYDEAVQQIKETVDIVEVVGEYVSLKRAGVNYKGLCPFHSEKTPSFTVNPNRRIFHCFGCHEGGDVLSFIMRYHNLPFPDAVKELAGRYNITLPERPLNRQEQERIARKKRIYDINRRALDIYHDLLRRGASAKGARGYLDGRGITDDIVAEFGLGFAPDSWDFILKRMKDVPVEELQAAGLVVPRDNGGHYDRFRSRLLCPIYDSQGKALGFGGRILGEGQPKYLNTPDSPVFNKSKVLFGLFQNKKAIRQSRRAILVEGNFDLLSLAANGIKDVVAPLGTALTRSHVKALKGYASEVLILFDGDRAGVQAALRAVPIFLAESLPAKVVLLPSEHDPDTYVKEFGRDGFLEVLEEARPLPEFVFERLQDKHGFSLAGKNAIVEELKPIVAAIGNDHLQRSLFLSHFSEKLGLTPEQMLQGLPVVPAKAPPRAKRSSQGDGGADVEFVMNRAEEQLLGFLIVYPEHLKELMEAGLEHAVTGEAGRLMLNHLLEFAERQEGAPEDLLDMVSGKARSFVSKCLFEVEDIDESSRLEGVAEKCRWLRENAMKARMRHLTEEINKAQEENDGERLMELLVEKSRLGERG